MSLKVILGSLFIGQFPSTTKSRKKMPPKQRATTMKTAMNLKTLSQFIFPPEAYPPSDQRSISLRSSDRFALDIFYYLDFCLNKMIDWMKNSPEKKEEKRCHYYNSENSKDCFQNFLRHPDHHRR